CANQIRRAEEFTTKAQGLKSGELMERVAEQLLLWLEEEILEEEDPVHLFCGVGDNGGDGLALARLLWESGFKAQVYVVDFGQKRSPGFLLSLDRLKGEDHGPEFMGRDSTLPELGPMDIVVDAIFGIGLSRPPEPWVGRLIE